MERQKRALAVHDISCIGKCSLTVALPVLSAADIECCALPTSVLSTHTGGFTGYTFRDLTEDILPIADHWSALELPFDAIYTGYLGSAQQTRMMEELFNRFKGPDTLVLVDPVMADGGKLYAGFDPDFPTLMANVCKKADVIVPNITEATLMLGEPYIPGPYSTDYIEALTRRLSQTFQAKVVLTGVSLDGTHLGAATYDPAEDMVHYAMNSQINGHFHGTGDVFGSGLLAALLRGFSLDQSAQIAADFTVGAIGKTDCSSTRSYEPYGVRFEAALPILMDKLGLLSH